MGLATTISQTVPDKRGPSTRSACAPGSLLNEAALALVTGRHHETPHSLWMGARRGRARCLPPGNGMRRPWGPQDGTLARPSCGSFARGKAASRRAGRDRRSQLPARPAVPPESAQGRHGSGLVLSCLSPPTGYPARRSPGSPQLRRAAQQDTGAGTGTRHPSASQDATGGETGGLRAGWLPTDARPCFSSKRSLSPFLGTGYRITPFSIKPLFLLRAVDCVNNSRSSPKRDK